MSTYAQTFNVNPLIGQQDEALTPTVRGWLLFWLPVAVTGLMLWVVSHDLTYSAHVAAEEADGVATIAEKSDRGLLYQLPILAIGSCGIALLVLRSDQRLSVNSLLAFSIAMYGVWIALSVLWSEDFALSVRKLLAFTLLVTAAFGFVKHWKLRQICKFTAMLALCFLAIGIAAEVAAGTFLRGPDYRFSGTLNPNDQAMNCVALALASLALYCESRSSTERRQGVLWLLPLAVGVSFLLLTKSRSGTVALALAASAFLYVGATPTIKMLMYGALALFLSIVAVVWLASEPGDGGMLIDAVKMGREQEVDDVASLTGRLPVWTSAFQDVVKKPFLGAGYGGFWTTGRKEDYAFRHDWDISHSHSVYLETLLNIGLIGLMLLVLIVVMAVASAIHSYHATGDVAYRFIAAVLVMAVIHGFLDANFVRNGFETFVAVVCIAGITLRQGRTNGRLETPVLTGRPISLAS